MGALVCLRLDLTISHSELCIAEPLLRLLYAMLPCLFRASRCLRRRYDIDDEIPALLYLDTHPSAMRYESNVEQKVMPLEIPQQCVSARSVDASMPLALEASKVRALAQLVQR